MKYVLKVTQAEVSQVQANSFGTCMYNTSSVLRFLCQVCKSLDEIVTEENFECSACTTVESKINGDEPKHGSLSKGSPI